MATFHQFTRSEHEGAVTDEEALRQLLAEYVVEPTVEIEDGKLVIYGYCGFEVWARDEERKGADHEDRRVREFLFRIADLVTGELRIKTIAHEKLRYVGAHMWRVKDGNVYLRDIEQDEVEVTEFRGGERVDAEATT
jgi:hypothetical protein